MPLARPLKRSPHQGAATSVLLASSPDVAGISGAFFRGGRVKRYLKGDTEDVAHRLWLASERLVHLAWPFL